MTWSSPGTTVLGPVRQVRGGMQVDVRGERVQLGVPGPALLDV